MKVLEDDVNVRLFLSSHSLSRYARILLVWTVAPVYSRLSLRSCLCTIFYGCCPVLL